MAGDLKDTMITKWDFGKFERTQYNFNIYNFNKMNMHWSTFYSCSITDQTYVLIVQNRGYPLSMIVLEISVSRKIN